MTLRSLQTDLLPPERLWTKHQLCQVCFLTSEQDVTAPLFLGVLRVKVIGEVDDSELNIFQSMCHRFSCYYIDFWTELQIIRLTPRKYNLSKLDILQWQRNARVKWWEESLRMTFSEQVGSERPASSPETEMLQTLVKYRSRRPAGGAARGGTRLWARGLELSSGTPPGNPTTVTSCTSVSSPL